VIRGPFVVDTQNQAPYIPLQKKHPPVRPLGKHGGSAQHAFFRAMLGGKDDKRRTDHR
jgi:hypothetical protein